MKWTVVGHKNQKEYIERMLSGGTLAHVYLLYGPQGVGKRMLAGELASELLSATGPTLANNPDFILLEPGVSKETGKPTEIPVESVRAMKVWAYQRPLYGTRKVVIIDDADRLGDAAANTLLKVIEEPPAYLTFLLVTCRPGRLLETITSRCQNISFTTLSVDDMEQILKTSDLDSDDRQILAAVAAGRPGIARSLIRERQLPHVAHAIADFEALLKAPITERIVAAKRFAEDPLLPDIVLWWLAWTHAQLMNRPQLAGVAHALLELSTVVGESKYNHRLALEGFFLKRA